VDAKGLPQYAWQGIKYSQWAYWCSLLCAAMSLLYLPPGSVRSIVILTPLLTELFCVSVTYWVYQQADEYLRLKLLLAVAHTAIALAFASLAYFCLELFGFPRLSMLWINLLGWSVFNLQLLWVIFRAR
jgi:hypothetical protein